VGDLASATSAVSLEEDPGSRKSPEMLNVLPFGTIKNAFKNWIARACFRERNIGGRSAQTQSLSQSQQWTLPYGTFPSMLDMAKR